MYRDRRTGLERRLLELRGEVAAILTALGGPCRFAFDEELLLRLQRAAKDASVLEDAEGQIASLEALLASVRDEAVRARALGEPTLIWEHGRTPLLFEEPEQAASRDHFHADVRAIHSDARFERSGDHDHAAFVVHDGVRILHRVRFDVRRPEDGDAYVLWLHDAMTFVPSRFPAFSVRRERAVDRAKAALHVAREVIVGNADFDARFWVQGPEDAMKALFGAPDLAAHLVSMDALTSVAVEDSMLHVRWQTRHGTALAYDAVARIVGALLPPDLTIPGPDLVPSRD